MRVSPDRVLLAEFAEDRPGRRATRGRQRGHPPDPGDPQSPADEVEEALEPAPPIPYATLAIIAVIVIVYVAMSAAGHGDVTPVALQFGAKDNALIQQGQYWRLVTPIFLHGSWLHLLVNGYSLWVLGGSMERIYGSKKYFLIFLAAGIAGNALSYRLSPTMSLGASGALFGLVGAGLIFPIRFRNLIRPEARTAILRQLAGVAAINLAIGFMLPKIIDNGAHVGGLLGGAFIALFLIPDVLEGERRSVIGGLVINALVVAGIGLVLASWFLQSRASTVSAGVTYYPATAPAWWSIAVPPRWRYGNGAWTAPSGATMVLTDRPTIDPVAGTEILSLVRAGAPLNTELDGRPGWFSTSPTRIEYRILAYDRLFELTLDAGNHRIDPQTKADFAAVVKSVRFIRSPYVFAPAPHTS